MSDSVSWAMVLPAMWGIGGTARALELIARVHRFGNY